MCRYVSENVFDVAHWSKIDRVRIFPPAAQAFTRPYRLVGGPVRPGGRLRKRGVWNVLEPEREWLVVYRPGRLGAA